MRLWQLQIIAALACALVLIAVNHLPRMPVSHACADAGTAVCVE
jgi:hypothetical protein